MSENRGIYTKRCDTKVGFRNQSWHPDAIVGIRGKGWHPEAEVGFRAGARE